MKKICFVTAARSEYGLLKWLMRDIDRCEEFQLQLIVTGGHLSYEQGHTADQILEDGFNISYTVDAELAVSSTGKIAESMGRMAEGMAKAFADLNPDYLVVLGDRYELLSICSTAFIMRIPIIHLSGGDVTEGAIDDGVRNAVTMLADYHFPGTEDSAANIMRMRGSDKNIWTVGELGLDAFNREQLADRRKLAENLGLDCEKKWVLMTYHAETKESLETNLHNVKVCMDCILEQEDFQTVITYANADFGGKQINEYVESQALLHPDRIKVIPSLGHTRYLSLMHQVGLVIGNSSSGIVEAPFLDIPVINVGNRQKGRYQCGNICQCAAVEDDIRNTIKKIARAPRSNAEDLHYWGDGHASEKIVNILKHVLLCIS